MGTLVLAADAAAKSSSSGSSSSFLIIIVLFAVLMIFMFRSQSRRRKAAQDTQNQVANGTRIRTVHGIYGTVVDSDDKNVLVEVSPGVEVKMLRQAIGTVLPDSEPDGILHTMPDEDDPVTDDDSQPDGDEAYAPESDEPESYSADGAHDEVTSDEPSDVSR